MEGAAIKFYKFFKKRWLLIATAIYTFVCVINCFACDAIFGSSGADVPLPVGLLEPLFILSQRSVDSACVPPPTAYRIAVIFGGSKFSRRAVLEEFVEKNSRMGVT